MNVLEILDNEIRGKNWTKEEKAYYIYLRCCQIFSYDPRYNILGFNSKELQQDIKNKLIDLENVTNNWVICNTYSEILATLLYDLLDISTILNSNCGHAWATFNDGKRQIKADSTIYLDISHIKMGLFPKGYSSDIENFNEILKQTSIKVGYINDEFNNYHIGKRVEQLPIEYVEGTTNPNFDDFMIYRLKIIKEILESFDNLKEFSDYEDGMFYLLKKVLKQDENITGLIQLYETHSKEKWDFVDIVQVYLKNQTLYYALEKVNDKYLFQEISSSDAKQYVKSLDGFNKGILKGA